MSVDTFGELAHEETGDQAHNALTVALRLAAAGYYLTPVTLRRRPDGKKGAKFHARGGWRHEGAWSVDPQQIRAWWVDNPDTSFAISCRLSGVEATDHDKGEDADGVQLWAEAGLPFGTFLVETPSGGWHSYWRARRDRHLPDSADAGVVRHVDTRSIGTEDGTSWGGILYAPGSYIVGEPGAYRIQGSLVPAAELEPTPDEVLDAFPAPEPKVYRADGAIVVKDRDVMAVKCQEALARLAGFPPRTGGSEFRDAQMGAAMMLGRFAEADGTPSGTWYLQALEQATITVWGSVSAADALNIESGLRDGPRKERWRWRPAEGVPATAPAAPVTEDEVRPAEPLRPVQEPPATPVSVQESRSTQSDPSWSAPGASVGAAGASVGATPGAGLREAQPASELEANLGDPNPSSSPLAVDPAETARRVALESELTRRWAKRAADEVEAGPRKSVRSGLVSLDAVDAPEWLVTGLVEDGAVTALGGPSGSYKSHVLVSLAVALAFERPVLERPEWVPTRRVRVLYVAAEGASGAAARLRATLHRAGLALDGERPEILFHRGAVSLPDAAAIAELREIIREEEIGYLIVDTWRQSTIGVEENSNTEQGRVLAELIRIRDEFACGSAFSHHTTKGNGDDLGGAGALRANVDSVLLTAGGKGEQRSLRVRKFRDQPEPDEVWPLTLIETEDPGRPKPSVVAVVAEGGAGEGGAALDMHGGDDWQLYGVPDAIADKGEHVTTVARLIQWQAPAGGAGISRAELIAQYKGVRPHLKPETAKSAARRAWDYLRREDVGLIVPAEYPNTAVSRHTWSASAEASGGPVSALAATPIRPPN